MSIPFALAGLHGEVSARPDRINGVTPPGGINGISFADYDYTRAGHASQIVLGLQMGTCSARGGTRITFSGDGAKGEVTGNAFALRIPGQVGHTAWTGEHTARFLVLTPNAIERIIQAPFSNVQAAPVICDMRDRMQVFHLLAALGHDRAGGGPTDPLLVESIALAVVRASGVSLPNEQWRRSPTLSTEQARRLRDLIAARIANPLNLRDMAEAAGLSESYFVRAFKGSFGVTPYQYVLRERVALAESLIRTGTVSLSEVAARSGFPDARRMGRTFRQITGRSPTGASRTRVLVAEVDAGSAQKSAAKQKLGDVTRPNVVGHGSKH